MPRWGLTLTLLTIASPAFGAERGYSVSNFDRVDVSGPYIVIVEADKSPSARASGSAEAIDRLTVETQGKTLRIRPSASSWGGWPGERLAAPTVRITVPYVREAYLKGSGVLSITRLRAQTARIGLSGSGRIKVDQIETDKLMAQMQGSGMITLSGKAAVAQMTADGSGSVEASALIVGALDLAANSSGDVHAAARQTARVISTGAGDVQVAGDPACTVTSVGSGQVNCGRPH